METKRPGQPGLFTPNTDVVLHTSPTRQRGNTSAGGTWCTRLASENPSLCVPRLRVGLVKMLSAGSADRGLSRPGTRQRLDPLLVFLTDPGELIAGRFQL